MAVTLKIRITGLGGASTPFIGWKYSDGMEAFEDIQFNWVPERTKAFEVTKWIDDYNTALKEAMEMDLVPSGEWSVAQDDYYLYITSNVPGRTLFPYIIYNTVVHTAEIYDTGEVQSPIDYVQVLPSNALLNAFNDNVIRFTVENQEKVNITANGELPTTLYPSPMEEYFLNLFPYSSVLINGGKYEDTIVPDIEGQGYVYPDPSLFLEMELQMNGTFLLGKAVYRFLKSVAQIANYAEKFADRNYILLPSPKVTYYEGYPFDIPVYAAKTQPVIFHNKTTGHSIELDVNKYTNRLFFSQGSEEFTIDDVLPMQTGFNTLELEFGPTDRIDLTVQKKESKCAPYFKFYRSCGGYGYIRFESEVGVKNSASEGESIQVDFNGIQNTIRRTIAGKTATVEMELQTEQLEVWEMENFKDFLSSPYVMMYTGGLFHKQTDKSWVGVKVSSSNLYSKRPKANKLKEKITVEFELYNLTL